MLDLDDAGEPVRRAPVAAGLPGEHERALGGGMRSPRREDGVHDGARDAPRHRFLPHVAVDEQRRVQEPDAPVQQLARQPPALIRWPNGQHSPHRNLLTQPDSHLLDSFAAIIV